MSTLAIAPELSTADEAVYAEARLGLASNPKTLPPWLFYDEAGSLLFEAITRLPEYYLTRTERGLFTAHAIDILQIVSSSTKNGHRTSDNPPVTIVELGAGTANKTGILLRALTRFQPTVLYQPIDISPTALDEARETIERTVPGVTVHPQTINYITEPVRIERPPDTKILVLYIGSSIGNFSPAEASALLTRLRSHLQPGDALLLGTDLAPGLPGNVSAKSVQTLLAAYNDAAGITAAFNRNILTRLNRELDANFDPARFNHRALWNAAESRIEMHLESNCTQTVRIPRISVAAGMQNSPALTIRFSTGETIHTENSYKFTPAAISTLLTGCSFTPTRTFTDPENLFAVTLATAI